MARSFAQASTLLERCDPEPPNAAFASLFGAGLFFAVAGATLRTGFLPRWWRWLSAIAGLWLLVSATAWAREGFWSPTGGVSWLGYIAFLLWFLVTSILLVRRTGGEPATSG